MATRRARTMTLPDGRSADAAGRRRPAAAIRGWAARIWKLNEPFLLGVVPVFFTTLVLLSAAQHDHFAVDFHYHFWPAAQQVLHGESPFPPRSAIVTLGSFIYPAFAAVVIVPFVLLPRGLADPLFVAILGGALLATLYAIRVRDWRCFGIVLLWPPVFHALHTANFTILIALGLAVLWRSRERSFAAGAVVGSIIALKIFLWPLVVWLAAARRYRAAGWSVAVAVGLTVGAWGVVGFAGFASYPHLVSQFDRISAPATYTLVGFGMRMGLSYAFAAALAWAIGLLALGAAVALTRREGLGARSFAAILIAAILLSPIVWLHYFTLLLVPFAILRPRFDPLWLVPLVAWPLAVGPSGPSLASFALLAGAVAFLFVAARRRPVQRDAEASGRYVALAPGMTGAAAAGRIR